MKATFPDSASSQQLSDVTGCILDGQTVALRYDATMAGVVNQQKCTFHAATAYVQKPWQLLPVHMFQILIN